MASPVIGGAYVQVVVGAASKNISASTLVKSGGGVLAGIFVASASSSPTIKVWNNTTNSTNVLVNTFTPIGGTWYPMPLTFSEGLYVEIGGTVDCTVSFS